MRDNENKGDKVRPKVQWTRACKGVDRFSGLIGAALRTKTHDAGIQSNLWGFRTVSPGQPAPLRRIVIEIVYRPTDCYNQWLIRAEIL